MDTNQIRRLSTATLHDIAAGLVIGMDHLTRMIAKVEIERRARVTPPAVQWPISKAA